MRPSRRLRGYLTCAARALPALVLGLTMVLASGLVPIDDGEGAPWILTWAGVVAPLALVPSILVGAAQSWRRRRSHGRQALWIATLGAALAALSSTFVWFGLAEPGPMGVHELAAGYAAQPWSLLGALAACALLAGASYRSRRSPLGGILAGLAVLALTHAAVDAIGLWTAGMSRAGRTDLPFEEAGLASVAASLTGGLALGLGVVVAAKRATARRTSRRLATMTRAVAPSVAAVLLMVLDLGAAGGEPHRDASARVGAWLTAHDMQPLRADTAIGRWPAEVALLGDAGSIQILRGDALLRFSEGDVATSETDDLLLVVSEHVTVAAVRNAAAHLSARRLYLARVTSRPGLPVRTLAVAADSALTVDRLRLYRADQAPPATSFARGGPRPTRCPDLSQEPDARELRAMIDDVECLIGAPIAPSGRGVPASREPVHGASAYSFLFPHGWRWAYGTAALLVVVGVYGTRRRSRA